MATLAPTALTLVDLAKRSDPNGNTADIAEVLRKMDPILDDILFVEGNLPTGHKTTIRTGLPTPTWRLLNYGVQPSKSRTAQVEDHCGMLEAYSQVDVDLAKLNGNSQAFLFSEELAFIQAMNNEFASTLFFGNTATDPEKFMGLWPRYNSTSTDSTQSGYNVLLDEADDTGTDYMSIWLVCWGPQTVHGIVPKGSTAGLQRNYMGVDRVTDAAGGFYQAHISHYKWDVGLTVRDWRYVVHGANLSYGDITVDTSGTNLADFMIRMIERLPDTAMGQPVFYMHKYLRTLLRRQMLTKTNLNLTWETIAGRKVLAFDGIPVRACDSLVYYDGCSA